jgi:hypothetical protein
MNLSKVLLCSLALMVALLSGCSTPKQEPVYADLPESSHPAEAASPAEAPATAQPSTAAADTAESAAEPTVAGTEKPALIVTPDESLTGSVVSVNDVGRFVVLRFTLGRLPAPEATLFVYRQGLKVAELKVTGPQKDDHTVADIRTGECRVKDEVRDR